jgi:hypothetical protein
MQTAPSLSSTSPSSRTDRLSDHTFRHRLEMLVQNGLELEELRPERRVDVRFDDPDHHRRATLTVVPIGSQAMSTEHGDEQGSRPGVCERKPELDRRFDVFEGSQAGPNPIRGMFRSTPLTLGAGPREQRLDFPELGDELPFLVKHLVPPSILSMSLVQPTTSR